MRWEDFTWGVAFRISVSASWSIVHGFWFRELREIMMELVYNLGCLRSTSSRRRD